MKSSVIKPIDTKIGENLQMIINYQEETKQRLYQSLGVPPEYLLSKQELIILRARLRLKRGTIRRSGQPNQGDMLLIKTLSSLIRNITNKIEKQ